MTRLCLADPLVFRLCETLGLDPNEVSCIAIVCAHDDVVRVKVERYADKHIEGFDFEGLVEGAPIS